MLAFDLDGTLIDSHDAVVKAYNMAGVFPPPDFWGKPWKEWLKDVDAHRAKNYHYAQPEVQALIRPLPLLDLFYFYRGGKVILTSASYEATMFIVERFQLLPNKVLCGLDLEGKIAELTQLQTLSKKIYFDDDLTTCQEVQRRTTWQVCHAMFAL